ncbi:MAG: SpoIIE family protein phosphatase [Phycisphaeraceae bacterium]|nr:SpoIIE family protein phosphatase [Phycisphaerales bacterium]MCB9860091.1 SpoIIE family protein phosphatase [Phycisphaeraceae bacterium]
MPDTDPSHLMLREINATYELTAMIAEARNLDEVVRIGLKLAIETLDLDAGAVMLMNEDAGALRPDEAGLERKASHALSATWLASPRPLSHNREFDRLALSGQIVTIEDLFTDPRVMLTDEVRQEGLRSAIHAGMIFRGRPVGVLRMYSRQLRTFSESEVRLARVIGQQLAVAVEQARLLQLQQHERQIQQQLSLAADVQRRMLPGSVPTVPGVQIAARWTPSLELAGDFYDFLERKDPDRIGFLIGDIVGKGVAAALLMSMVRSSFRAHTRRDIDIDQVMTLLNRDICRDTVEGEFATLFYGEYNPQTRTLRYASAGHDPALVYRADSGKVELLHRTGMLMGVIANSKYAINTCQLSPGDTVFLYTDGLTDAHNFDKERFGRVRLMESLVFALHEHRASPVRVALDTIFAQLRNFAGLAKRPDDQTAILMRVNPDGTSDASPADWISEHA